VINAAIAFLGIKEPTDFSEMLVLLASKNPFFAKGRSSEPPLSLHEGELEMSSQPIDVGFCDGDLWVGAAITRAFLTIVL
jgi:hypothetical protein